MQFLVSNAYEYSGTKVGCCGCSSWERLTSGVFLSSLMRRQDEMSGEEIRQWTQSFLCREDSKELSLEHIDIQPPLCLTFQAARPASATPKAQPSSNILFHLFF